MILNDMLDEAVARALKAQDSVDAALKVYDAFEEAFGLLAEQPGLTFGPTAIICS